MTRNIRRNTYQQTYVGVNNSISRKFGVMIPNSDERTNGQANEQTNAQPIKQTNKETNKQK